MNAKNGSDIPLGLGMALMQNADAFFYFSALDEAGQQKVIDGCKGVKSRSLRRRNIPRQRKNARSLRKS